MSGWRAWRSALRSTLGLTLSGTDSLERRVKPGERSQGNVWVAQTGAKGRGIRHFGGRRQRPLAGGSESAGDSVDGE